MSKHHHIVEPKKVTSLFKHKQKQKQKKKKKRRSEKKHSHLSPTTILSAASETVRAEAKAKAEVETASANETAKKLLNGVLTIGESVDPATMSMRSRFAQTQTAEPG